MQPLFLLFADRLYRPGAFWGINLLFMVNWGSPGKPCICDWLILCHIHPKWHFGGWNIVFRSPVHPKFEFHGYRPRFLFSASPVHSVRSMEKLQNGKNIVRFFHRISFWEHSVKIRFFFNFVAISSLRFGTFLSRAACLRPCRTCFFSVL